MQHCFALEQSDASWVMEKRIRFFSMLVFLGKQFNSVHMCCQSNSHRSGIICWHVLHVTVTSLCAPPCPALMISTNNLKRCYSTHTLLHTTRDEWNSWCHQRHPGPNGKMFGCYSEVPCKCRGLLCTRLFLKAPQYTNVHILIFPPRS